MKKLFQIIILILPLIILLFPAILLLQSFNITKEADIIFFIHRALGLYAFSLIFLAIISSSAMSLVDRIFPADKVFKTHQIIGGLAFAMAMLHPVFLYSIYFLEGNLNYILPFQQGNNMIYFSFGILAYVLLIITVTAAILRFRLGPRWLYIHRLNYFIFWLIFFHGLNLGVDLTAQPARLLYMTYGVIVGILTIRKILYLGRHFIKFN